MTIFKKDARQRYLIVVTDPRVPYFGHVLLNSGFLGLPYNGEKPIIFLEKKDAIEACREEIRLRRIAGHGRGLGVMLTVMQREEWEIVANNLDIAQWSVRL